jgi:hypothetical protein
VLRSDRRLLAGVSAAVLVLVAACGTQHGTSSNPVTGPTPTPKPSVPHCPQVLAGGLLSTDLWVFKGAAADGVAFSGYERVSTRTPVCAWGSVSVKTIDLETGGITREGGCVPSAGGH